MTHPMPINICGQTIRIVPNEDENSPIIETLIYDGGPFGIPLEYRIYGYAAGKNCDPYRYESPKGSKYSHPTLSGARNMIASDLVDLNIIPVPGDNAHLSSQNMSRLRAIINARNTINSGGPLLGDFIIIDHVYHRFCNILDFGAQTTRGGSFHIGTAGGSSYSGGLDRARAYEWIKPCDEFAPGRFWMWDAVKGMGAGNGIDVMIDVPVWRLEPVEISRNTAENHPRTLRTKAFYEDSLSYEREVEKVIASLMQGYV